MLEKLLKEIKNHSTIYLLFGIILISSFLIRVWRINDLLNFYYDQGRDALVIWDFIYKGKWFLIGPTTGLAGIFRGPYYYYLIAPFYWLGHGNPVYPDIFLILISVISIGFIYYLGAKIESRFSGIIAATLASFSFYIVMASKWLSNPTPMLLLSMVLVWSMLKVTEGKKWAWPIITFCAGLSLFNFGSAGELFYLPAIAIFFIWTIFKQGFGKKSSLGWKTILLSVITFSLTFLPLVVFDFKHGHILRNNIYQTFIAEKSFILPTKYLFETRTPFYYDVFTNKLFDSRGMREKIVLGVVGFWFLISLPKYIKNKGYAVLILLLASPLIGLYFYQGNETVLYDYYMTGYYLIFILLFSLVLGDVWRFKLGKIFVLYFVYLFLFANLSIVLPRLNDRSDGPEVVELANQREAIDWVYKNAADRDFNVDTYVPPVIPYAYNYLFQWLGTYQYHKLPKDNRVSLLYTLYEVDPPHPERLQAWLDRQKGIGKVIREQRFGGITVQERERLIK